MLKLGGTFQFLYTILTSCKYIYQFVQYIIGVLYTLHTTIVSHFGKQLDWIKKSQG